MTKQFLSFSLSRALFELAFNVGSIFGIIYLYLLFDNSLVVAFGAFAIICILQAFFLAISAKRIGRVGIRYSLILGTILFFMAFMSLVLLDKANPAPFVVAWIALYSAGKALYFIPVHYYFLHYSEDHKRGDALGKLSAIIVLLSIFMPLIGGTISDSYGLAGMSVFAGLVLILSLVPLFGLPNLKFSFTGNLQKLLSMPSTKRELRILLTNTAQNIESIWQLFVFILLNGNFLDFGLLLTLVNMLSFIFNWFLAKFWDRQNKIKLLKLSGLATAAIWIGRMFVNNPLTAGISNLFFHLVAVPRNQIVSLIDYDYIQRDDSHALIDERLIAKEVFWNLFASLIVFAYLGVVLTVGWQGVFVLAALAALSFLLL